MKALSGIRILDLSKLLPGPYCSMVLADFGAEVIKVEEPKTGDYSRTFPPFKSGFGYWHLQLNRNKKSIAIDLKSEIGRKAFLKMVRKSDVVLESYRLGVLKRLGIDYETASRLNPKIVYCSITGYGKKGPLVHQPDHDIGYLGLTGVLSMSCGKNGMPAIPGVLMADMNAALMAGMSILMAVRYAEKSGSGQEIDISLYNTALTLMPGAASLYFGSGFVAERGNNWLTGAYANYNIYKTKDDLYLAVGCLEKKFWTNLCVAIQREDLINAIDDEKGHEHVKAGLTAIFKTRTQKEWTELLGGKDTCVEPVLTFDEALAAEQTTANDMVLDIQDEDIGEYKQMGFAMKLYETPGRINKRAPRLGEDTEVVLREIGFSNEEISKLQEK